MNDEQPTSDKGEKKYMFTSISYFPDGKQMIGGSTDNLARRWDLQTGREIGDARVVCNREVYAVAVSRDSRWIITGGGDRDHDDLGELKACEVETNMMKTFKGHSRIVSSIDISMDNKLLASGSFDHTTRIWDMDTGKLMAGPFECADMVGAIRFSQDLKKLVVKSSIYSCTISQYSAQRKTEASLPHLAPRIKAPGRSMNSMHQRWRLSVLLSKHTPVTPQL